MLEQTLRYTNEDTGYEVFIADGEDLLTDAQEEELTACMIPITEYGNVVFESASLYRQSTKDYISGKYDRYWNESASVFLIDMGERDLGLYSSGKIAKTVTPSYASSITDNVYRYASRGDYFGCAAQAFTQEATVLAGGRIAQPMKYISCALLAVIAALLVNYLIMRRAAKNSHASQSEMMRAVAVSTVMGAAATTVTKRIRHARSSGGGHYSGGTHHYSGGSHSGGSHHGGGFSGGHHKF